MPIDPPPRRKLPSVREVDATSGAPHTPVPPAPWERTLHGLAPPAERRPAPANPPPPGSVRPPAPTVPDGHVTLGRGPWSLTMPSVVALAIIASVGGFATAWLNKPSPGDPAAVVQAVREEMGKQKAEIATQYKTLLERVDANETKTDRLQGSIDSVIATHIADRLSTVETKVDRLQRSQDDLHDRVNDKLK